MFGYCSDLGSKLCDCLPPSSSVGSSVLLSVSVVLSLPRSAAAPLLMFDWVTAGDGLAPAVDSVVVTPRKTVEPRLDQRKKCGIRCTLLLPPGGLFNCGFLWGRTLHAQRLNQFSGQRFAFQNIGKSEKLSTFTRVDLYDTRSPPPPRRHYWPLSEMVLVSRWRCCCWPIPTHRTAPQLPTAT